MTKITKQNKKSSRVGVKVVSIKDGEIIWMDVLVNHEYAKQSNLTVEQCAVSFIKSHQPNFRVAA